MKPKGKGHIITLVSMAGQRTNPGAPIYCASKFGARGLSSGLADQVIKAGIKVSDINPGDWIFGDIDGVVSVPGALAFEVLEKAEEILNKEVDIRKMVDSGMKPSDVIAKGGYF
jgi:NAD(P)-dependent dehydrogenase (short-subunit alcohol dehydrogenase family)